MAFLMIIFICYIVVALIRKTPLQNEWLPLISGGIGIVLSLVAFYALPSIVPADSLGTTLFYGFFCGLAATGSNQVFKQAVKYLTSKFNVQLPPTNENDKRE